MINICVFVCLSIQGSKIGQCSSGPRWPLQAGGLRHVQRGHSQWCVHGNLLWDTGLHCSRGQFPHLRYTNLSFRPTATVDDRHFVPSPSAPARQDGYTILRFTAQNLCNHAWLPCNKSSLGSYDAVPSAVPSPSHHLTANKDCGCCCHSTFPGISLEGSRLRS